MYTVLYKVTVVVCQFGIVQLVAEFEQLLQFSASQNQHGGMV